MARTTGDEAIEAAIIDAIARCEPDKTVGPTDIARALGGAHPDGWGPLMPPVRQVAVRLMKQGRLVILRKGRPVDPDDFKGVYRLAPTPIILPRRAGEDENHGPGNSASV